MYCKYATFEREGNFQIVTSYSCFSKQCTNCFFRTNIFVIFVGAFKTQNAGINKIEKAGLFASKIDFL